MRTDPSSASSPTDEGDCARARAVLDRLPPEPADRRARRLAVQRRLSALGAAVTAVAVVIVLLSVVVDRAPVTDGPPDWRTGVGVALQGLGLVLMLGAYAVHAAAVRHTRGWTRPLHWLSRREHRGLLRQVRGKDAVVPGQLPLARHAARLFLVQRSPMAAPSGFLLVFAGQQVATPGTVRLVLVALMAVAVGAAEVQVRRDVRRVRRFLAEHPDPDPL